MKLYDFPLSGNCYKVRLLLANTGQRYDRVEVDRVAGETRKPAYLAKNPAGKIPLLELDDGQLLPESNAILNYLAEGTHYLPNDRLDRARVLQWQFFEQASHMPNIAIVRYWIGVLNKEKEFEAQIAERRPLGYAALDLMENHLKARRFFVGEKYSVADISLYAYTHIAGDGKFDMGRYPAIRGWLGRVEDQPGYVPLL